MWQKSPLSFVQGIFICVLFVIKIREKGVITIQQCNAFLPIS